MEKRDAERFEEGIDSEFQDAEEVTTGETGEMVEAESHGVGGFHGGFGSATLRECLDRTDQSRTEAPATRRSGDETEEQSIPPQSLSTVYHEDI